MSKNVTIIIILLWVFSVGYALEVKVVSPSDLPKQLEVGEEVSITLEIQDYSYGNAEYLSLDTDLISSKGNPIYDFGRLNERYGDINTFEKQIKIPLPRDVSIFTVTIKGRVPSTEKTFECVGAGVTLIRYPESDLKYYEISLLDGEGNEIKGNKDIKSFMVVFPRKTKFYNELAEIDQEYLKELKKEARTLFERGFVNEAEVILKAMKNIKTPAESKLFWVISVRDEKILNGTVFLLIVIAFVIGLKVGGGQDKDKGNGEFPSTDDIDEERNKTID